MPTTLWAQVKDRYPESMLIGLTNVRDRSKKVLDDNVGEAAAAAILALFPAYVQLPYDSTNAQHVEVAVEGVIAMLWKRGGTAVNAERVKWETWEAMATAAKNTDPRGHAAPGSNSQTTRSQECVTHPCRPWTDRTAFRHLLPRPTGVQRPPEEWM